MRYYVYILLDDRVKGDYKNNYAEVNNKPFYIGKGDFESKNKQERHLTHYNDVLLENKNCEINPHKSRTIKKLLNLKFKPNFKIIFKSDDENEVFKVECELVEHYGRVLSGGILTNITIGGSGGDTFTNNSKKEEIRLKHKENTKGIKNPMYGRSKFSHPSHLSKMNGKHWNKGKKRSEKVKSKMKVSMGKRPKISIVIIDIKTLEEIDILTADEIMVKYKIKTRSLIYKCVKHGGSANGYLFRYLDKNLVLNKRKRSDYVKPKDNAPKGYRTTKNGVIKVSKAVCYKKSINDLNEIVFDDVNEASEFIGLNVTVIRRKCKNNNTHDNIFRWDNKDYTFNVKIGNNKKGVIRINKDGSETEFESLKEAAESIGGKTTSVLAVCKGRNKTYKGLVYKYKNK